MSLLNKIMNKLGYINKHKQVSLFEDNHLYQMGDFKPNDVFIVGYPKSGNTWMQHLISSLVFEINPLTMPDKLVQDLVPDIYHQKYFKRYWHFGFFKSHELPNPKYKKVIYLIRDGRDVMVSYYHYLNNVENRSIGLKELIEGKDIFPSKWHIHVKAWIENPFNSEILYIKYEDMLDNPISVLEKVSNFLGIERNSELLKVVAEGCSFENMKTKNQIFGWGHKMISNNNFLREGKKGDYLDKMPSNLKELFETEAMYMLEQQGYKNVL